MKTFMRILTIVLSMSLALFATVDVKSQAVNQLDSLALVDFYNNCGGQNWSNTIANNAPWLQGPVSGWYGVTVSQGVVTDIQLPENAVTGMFPSYITPGALASLGTVDLRGNAMHGPFPYALGDLPVLTELDISFNQFNGWINDPPTGVFPDLEVLNMGNNEFEGSVPLGVRNFFNLRELRINNNKFVSVPNLIDYLPNFTILWVYENQLDFESLEANPTFMTEYFYAPQDSLGFHRGHDIDYGSDYTIDIEVGGTGNQYQWYKDNMEIPGATQEDLLITNASGEDEGEYVCHITSTVVPDITLYTYPIEIWVEFTGEETDRMALEAIYTALDGANWTNSNNWMSQNDISTWFGVTVDPTTERVTELNLPQNGLDGMLPLELGILSELRVLNMHSNNICCLFESEGIGGLVNLEVMNLANNNIAGDFPEFREDDDEMLLNLKVMDLSYNSITGTIPENIWLFANLEELIISNNQLSGPFPTGIGPLQHLRIFDISYNNYFGEIPSPPDSEVEGIKFKADPQTEVILPAIEIMNISHNDFSGDVPTMLNMFTTLTELNFGYNRFTSIPFFGDLVNLDVLQVEENNLDFSSIEPNTALGLGVYTYSPQAIVGHKRLIPAQTGDEVYIEAQGNLMPNNTYVWYKELTVDELKTLELIPGETGSEIHITSVGASDFASYVCEISNTVATGLTLTTERIEVVEYSTGEDLDRMALEELYNACGGTGWTGVTNWMTGAALSEWTGVTVDGTSGRVTALELPNVGLMGNLPTEITLLGQLRTLNLSNNGITGPIPAAINDIANLEVLNLSYNQLSGELPPQIGGFDHLQTLSLRENQITGTIPEEIGFLTSLTALSFGSNQMFGEVPVEIGNLTNLTTLFLSGNKFHGRLPDEIGNLVNLERLGLNSNKFQGDIPLSINNLVNLRDFYLDDNKLEFLPELTMPGLEDLRVENNDLDFCSLIPNKDVPSVSFTYSPQGPQGDDDFGMDVYLEKGQTHVLEADICAFPGSVFQWFHGMMPIPGANSYQHTIESASFYNQGDYYCEVTDPTLPGLMLRSDRYYIEVNDDPLPDGWEVIQENYQYSGEIWAELFMNGQPFYQGNMYKSDEWLRWGAIAAFYDGDCRGVSDDGFINEDGELIFRIDVFSNVENQENLEFKFFNPYHQPYFDDGTAFKSMDEQMQIFDINETVLFTTDGFIDGSQDQGIPLNFDMSMLPPSWNINPEDFQYHNIVYSEIFMEEMPIYQSDNYKELPAEFEEYILGAFDIYTGNCVGLSSQPFIENGKMIFETYIHSNNESGDEIYFELYAPGLKDNEPDYKSSLKFDPMHPIVGIVQTIIFNALVDVQKSTTETFGTTTAPFRMDIIDGGQMLPEGWSVDYQQFTFFSEVYAELFVMDMPLYQDIVLKEDMPMPYVALAAFNKMTGQCVGVSDNYEIVNGKMVHHLMFASNMSSGEEIEFKVFNPDIPILTIPDPDITAKQDPIGIPMPIWDIEQTIMFDAAIPTYGGTADPYRFDIDISGGGGELPEGWLFNPDDYQYHNFVFAELYIEGAPVYDPGILKEGFEFPYVALGAFINDVCVGINDEPQINRSGKLVFNLQYFSNNQGDDPLNRDEVRFKVFAPDFYNMGPILKEIPIGDPQIEPVFDISQSVFFIDTNLAPPHGSFESPFRMDVIMPGGMLPPGWDFDPANYQYHNFIYAELYLEGMKLHNPDNFKEGIDFPYVAVGAFINDMCVGINDQPQLNSHGELVFHLQYFSNNPGYTPGQEDQVHFKVFAPDFFFNDGPDYMKEMPDGEFWPIFDVEQVVDFIHYEALPPYGSLDQPYRLDMLFPDDMMLPDGWWVDPQMYNDSRIYHAEIFLDGSPLYPEELMKETAGFPMTALAAFDEQGVCRGVQMEPELHNGKLVYSLDIFRNTGVSEVFSFKFFSPDIDVRDWAFGFKETPLNAFVTIYDLEGVILIEDSAPAEIGSTSSPMPLEIIMPMLPEGWSVNHNMFQYHNMVYAEIWDEGQPVYREGEPESMEHPYAVLGAFIDGVCVGLTDEPVIEGGKLVYPLRISGYNDGTDSGTADEVIFKAYVPDFAHEMPGMKEEPIDGPMPIFDFVQTVMFMDENFAPSYGELTDPFRLDVIMPKVPWPEGWEVNHDDYQYHNMVYAEIWDEGQPVYREEILKEVPADFPYVVLAAFNNQGCVGITDQPEVINGKLIFPIQVSSNNEGADPNNRETIYFQAFVPEYEEDVPPDEYNPLFDFAQTIQFADASILPSYGTTSDPFRLDVYGRAPNLPDHWVVDYEQFAYEMTIYSELFVHGEPLYQEDILKQYDYRMYPIVLAAFNEANGECVGIDDEPTVENGKLIFNLDVASHSSSGDDIFFQAYIRGLEMGPEYMKEEPIDDYWPIYDIEQTIVFDMANDPIGRDNPFRMDVIMGGQEWPEGWDVNRDDYQYHNMVFAEIWESGYPVYGDVVLKEVPQDFPYVVLGAFHEGVCVGVTDQPQVYNGKLVFPLEVSSNNLGDDPMYRDDIYFLAYVPDAYNNGEPYLKAEPVDRMMLIFEFEQFILFEDASIAPSYGTMEAPMRLDLIPPGPELPDHWVVDYNDFDYIQSIYSELYIGGEPLYMDPLMKEDQMDMPPIVIAAFNEANGMCVGLTDDAEVYQGKLVFQLDVASNTSSGDDIFFQVYLPDYNMGPDYMKQQVDQYWPIFNIEQMIVFDENNSPLGSMTDPFRMDIMVGGFPEIPDGWVVNPAEYEFDGEITAEVLIDEMPAPPGVLAAFVNGECRGVMSEPQMGPTQKLVYIMRVYSNSAAGETVEFKYYNPRLFDGTIEGMKEGEEPNPLAMAIFDIVETVQFTSNMTIGNAVAPFEMNASSEREFNKPMNQGWTWFSVFVVTEDMSIDNLLSSLQPQDGDYIKDRKDLGNSATYIVDGQNTGWYGTLTHLDPRETYKIRLTNAADLIYPGYPMDITEETIPVEPGWNWIGYPLPFPMPVSDYLTTLNKVEGDYIKDQIESATYYDDGGWFGTLNMMMPGDGYVINVANEGAIHEPEDFQFKSHTITTKEGKAYEVPKYSVLPSKFEFSGSATIEVFTDGYNVGSESNILYAFNSNEECIGIVNGKLFPVTNTYIYNLMMYSNVTEGDEISFKFYNNEDTKWYAYEETLTFEADMIVANAYHPFELRNATEIDADGETSVSEIYPNPFVDQLTVKFSVNETQNIRIEAYDGQGRLIDVVVDAIFAPGEYSEDWYALGLTEGVYFIRIIKDSGVENLKVLKVK